MVGVRLSQDFINDTLGAAARDLNVALVRANQFHEFLAATPDPDLIDLGFDSGEIATLKSAFADLHALFEVYRGAATQAETKDFRTFAKRVWGFGV
jgi:hypothetical protein